MRYQDVFATPFDLIATLPFIALVPYMVGRSFRGLGLSERFYVIVTAGGWAWLTYAYASDTILYWLGTPPLDVVGHHNWSLYIAKQIGLGNWTAVRSHSNFGNDLYQVYVGFIYAFTGLSVRFVIMLNAFIAFCASLALFSGFRRIYPAGSPAPLWGILVIFFPSVVFWTTANSKEALMYWSICQVVVFVLGQDGRRAVLPGPLTITAMAVGLLLRPHVMGCWLAAVFAVAVIKFRKLAYVALLAPCLFVAGIGAERLTGMDVESVDSVVAYGQAMNATLQRDKTQGSNIGYAGGGPVLFVSGLVSIFFRPFPWQIDSLRIALNCLEAWCLTLAITWGWMRAGGHRLEILKLPPVLVSLLVCMGFAVFLTFVSNVGLMVRQKIQIVPALLALSLLPAFHCSWSRESQRLLKRATVPHTASRAPLPSL